MTECSRTRSPNQRSRLRNAAAAAGPLLALMVSAQCPTGAAFSHANSNSSPSHRLSVIAESTRSLLGAASMLPRRKSCSSSSSYTTSLSMCICINCARVTSCQGYHFVESMHSQPHMDADPQFDPQDGSPTIHVNYRTVMSDRAESEFERMMREHKAEEERAEDNAKKEQDAEAAGRTCEVDENGQPLHGEEKYDLSPTTTVEYDVVECADYVEDMGIWVRNMPEEIRKANPNFVPT